MLHSPHQPKETESNIEKRAIPDPINPLTESATLRQEKLSVLGQQEAESKAQDRRSAIEAFLIEQDFLGLPLDDPDNLAQAVDKLLRAEQKSRELAANFDITAWSIEKIQIFLTQKTFKSDIETKSDQYQAFLSQHADLPAIDLMKMALDNAVVPPAEALRLQAYLRIRDLATTPADQAIIEARINAYPIADMPDPVRFIQQEIFANPQISQQTQNAIAQAFHLTPRRNVTGSEVYRNLSTQKINPDTGKAEYVFTRDQPMRYRDGLTGFIEGDGQRLVRVATDEGWEREVNVTGWSGDDIGSLSEYFQFWKATEEGGINNFIESLYFADTDLNQGVTLEKLALFRRVMNGLMGGEEGYDGAIFGKETTDFLKWQLQMLSPKGSAVAGDHDIEATHANLQALGIKDKNGRLNFEVLKEVGRYSQTIYLRGEPSFEGLQKHLQARFPKWVNRQEQ